MAQENNFLHIALGDEMAFTPNEYTLTIWNRLTQVFTEQATAGLMGNLWAESTCTPYACQPSRPKSVCLIYIDNVDNGVITETQFVNGGCSSTGGYTSTQLGFGLAQWTETSRKQDFYTYMKSNSVSIGDLDKQLDFIIDELSRKFPSIYSLMQTTTSIYEVSDLILEQFENPADQSEAVHLLRRQYSQQVFDIYASGSLHVYVNTIGNGFASVDKPSPNYDEDVTLTCVPNAGETLVDIIGETISGQSVALDPLLEVQTFSMPNESVIITVTFSGIIPPPVIPSVKKHMPIWMYPMFRKD